MNMSEENKNVPRETPPVNDLGPILEIDMDELQNRLMRMSPRDRDQLMDLLTQYAVMIKVRAYTHEH